MTTCLCLRMNGAREDRLDFFFSLLKSCDLPERRESSSARGNRVAFSEALSPRSLGAELRNINSFRD